MTPRIIWESVSRTEESLSQQPLGEGQEQNPAQVTSLSHNCHFILIRVKGGEGGW